MSLRIVVMSILIACFAGCGITAAIQMSDMIEEINIASPIGDREPLIGYPGQVWRVIRKHQRLYPESNRTKIVKRLMFIASGVLIVAAVLLFGRAFWT